MSGGHNFGRVGADTLLPAGSDAPRLARRWVESLMGAHGVHGTTDEVLLVLSELVTNAVVHGRGAPRVHVDITTDEVTVEVHDDLPGKVEARPVDDPRLGGVGLRIVGELAEQWGTTPDPRGGKTVWATLARDGDKRGAGRQRPRR